MALSAPTINKTDDNPISATWKIKGFPQYYKTGHVKSIMMSLKLDVIDVYKKTPNLTAFVRFKSIEEKLRAKPIINAYTEKKIKRLHCIEHPNRKQFENDLAKAERKAKRRKTEDNKTQINNDDSSQRQNKKQRRIRVQATSIHEVVTPLFQQSYEEQLQIKRKKICKDIGTFRRKMTNPRFMNQDFLTWLPSERGAKNLKNLCPVLGIISSPITKAYRNKVSLSIGYNKMSNKLTIGFQLGRFEHGAASIESCQECINIDIISKRIARCSQIFVREQHDKYKYDCFDKKTHEGVWRKLNVRISTRSKQFIVTLQIQNRLITNEEYDRLKKDFTVCICNEAEKLKKEFDYDLNGVTMLINNTVSTANNNDCPVEILYGNNYHYEYICGLKFRISSTAFFQINTVSAERLYETAANYAIFGVDGKKIVLFDICCGTGTIGLCVAKQCGDNIKKLIGLELIEDAVKDAKFNADLNNFNNTRFIAGKAEETLQKALDKEVDIDDYVVAILDPPRCGVHKDICKLLRMQQRIQRIIYVSCNSASCINDAIRLCQTPSKKTVGTPFKPIKAIGVDLFPHTDHVEMIMHLERCNDNDVDWTKLSHQASESQRKYLYEQSQKDKMKKEINAIDGHNISNDRMSILGKRRREETDSKENDEFTISSPPKKRLKAMQISNDKEENDDNDMDIDDNKDKSMEIDERNNNKNTNSNSNTNNNKSDNKKVCCFTMEAVINKEFKTITDNYLNDKWSILYFYPHDFEKRSCSNLKCLNEKVSQLKSLNAQIIGISTESHYAHFAWIESKQNGLGSNFQICIASDLSTMVSKKFGVLKNGYSTHSAFIISPTKSIEYSVEFGSNMKSQIMTDQLLETMKSLQSKET